MIKDNSYLRCFLFDRLCSARSREIPSAPCYWSWLKSSAHLNAPSRMPHASSSQHDVAFAKHLLTRTKWRAISWLLALDSPSHRTCPVAGTAEAAAQDSHMPGVTLRCYATLGRPKAPQHRLDLPVHFTRHHGPSGKPKLPNGKSNHQSCKHHESA